MQPEGSQLKMKIACQINGNEGFQLQTAANSKETNTSKYIKTVEMKQGTCFERYLVIFGQFAPSYSMFFGSKYRMRWPLQDEKIIHASLKMKHDVHFR